MNIGAHYGDTLDTCGNYTVIRCQECGFVHVTPIPDERTLFQFYQDEFYQKAKPDYVQRYEQDRTWWEMHHTQTIQQAAGFLRKNGTAMSVLDVGAGPGIFLDVARRMHWLTYGVEPSIELCKAMEARGHKVVCGGLADMELEENSDSFQYINLYEVLEHVPHPVAFLAKCRDFLVDGGIISIVVPNDYNPLQLEAVRRFNLPHYWLAPPQHLNYFNPPDLITLLQDSGFSILECRGTFPMEQFILDGYNYVGNDALGRECHQSRMKYELEVMKAGTWPALMQTYRNNLAQNGTGREIAVLARKVY